MKREETIKIMAMLSAFYGQGKSDASTMASAWHIILRDYDYHLAERAVIEFARTDKRDYATFPSVGQVVSAIERQKGYVNRIYNGMLDNEVYDSLPEGAQRLISEADYEAYRRKGYEALEAERETIIEALQGKQKRPMLEE